MMKRMKFCSLLLALSFVLALCPMLMTPAVAAQAETPKQAPVLTVENTATEIWDGTVGKGFAGGSGTKDDPFLISNGKELAYLAQQTNAGTTYAGQYFKLTADIRLNDVELLKANYADKKKITAAGVEGLHAWGAIGTVTNKVSRSFSGFFDGNGKVISGMWICYTVSQNDKGLFGNLQGGEVKNLTLEAPHYFTGANNQNNMGFITGAIGGGAVVDGCRVLGGVVASNISNTRGIGGIAGNVNGNATIQNCVLDSLRFESSSTGLNWSFLVASTDKNIYSLYIKDNTVTNSQILASFNGKSGPITNVAGALANTQLGSVMEITNCKFYNCVLEGNSSVGGILGTTGSNPYVNIDGCHYSGSLKAVGYEANPSYTYLQDTTVAKGGDVTYHNGHTLGFNNGNNTKVAHTTKHSTTIGGVIGTFACTSSGITLSVMNTTVDADIDVELRNSFGSGGIVPLNQIEYQLCMGGIAGWLQTPDSGIVNCSVNVRFSKDTSVVDPTAMLEKMDILRDNLDVVAGGELMKDGTTTKADFLAANCTAETTWVHGENIGGIVGKSDRNNTYHIYNNLVMGSSGGLDVGRLLGDIVAMPGKIKVANNVVLSSFGAAYDVCNKEANFATPTSVVSVLTDKELAILNDETLAKTVTHKYCNGTKNPTLKTVEDYTNWSFGPAPEIAGASVSMASGLSLNFYAKKIALLGDAPTVLVAGEEVTGVEKTIGGIAYYAYSTGNIKPADLGKDVDVAVKLGSLECGTLSYSILDYATRKYEQADDALCTLLEAIMLYGDAATEGAAGLFEALTGTAYDSAIVNAKYEALEDLFPVTNPDASGNIQMSLAIGMEKVTPVVLVAPGAQVVVTYPWLDGAVTYTAGESGEVVLEAVTATALNARLTITVGDETVIWNVSAFVDAILESNASDYYYTLAQATAVYMSAVRAYATAREQ